MITEKAPITDRRQRRTLLLGLGFLVFCVLQLLAYQLWLSYQEQIVDAETQTRNYAAIFEMRLDATLRRTDAILQGLSRSLPAQALARPVSASYAAQLGEALDAHLLHFDELAGLRIFDRNGDLLNSSNGPHTLPANVADRAYFRSLQNRPQSGLLFSEVIISRATGRPSLIIARALQDPQSGFLGIVTAVLDLDRQVEIFRSVDVGSNGVISFRRSDDHRQVVRWPSVPGRMNQELDPDHPLRPPMARGDRTGTLHFASQTDGIQRIYSFHRLEHYPFYFIIGVSFDDVLAGWRTRALVVGACGFLLLALFAALLLRLWRSETREAQVVANLVDSERQQRDNGKRLQIFERLVENAGQGIGMTHPDGTITYANPELLRLLDLPANAVYHDYSFNHFYTGENRRKLREEVLPAVLQTGQWTGELELSSLGKRSIPAIHTLFVVHNAAGETPIIAVVLADVSEHRQAEQVSRLLLQAVEYSPVAIVITSRNGEIEYVNPSFTQMTGFSRSEAIGQNTRFLKSGETPPETYQQLWQTLLEGKVWNGILHNRRKNGELFWEQTSISPVFGDHGEVTHYLAVKEDISDRHVTETRLRLLAGVFEHSAEAIMVNDRDNRILEVNKAFCRLTGYAADEVRGENPRRLSSGLSPPETYRAMWQSINRTGHWQGEIWDRRKDGSVYPKWLSISTICGSDGNIEHYIGSFVDISERKAAEERISHLAHFDTLTDLPNRSNLQGRLEQALAAARRDSQHRPLAVMFLDLDRFKNINDTLGHHVGDSLLLEVSKRLMASVRESDVVARLGGDEFVVVLTGADAIAAERVASKILTTLSQPYHLEGQRLHTTSSIGIAVFPGDGESVDILMRNADAAMYHAKSAGRNNMQFFTASMNQAASDRRQLEEDLHMALQKNQFILHYQPQVDELRRIVAAEALLRWQHPEHGLVPPNRFIPLAEDTGLIVPIGHWVLETACAQLRAWSVEARTRDLQLAVNVSARQFRQADFVEQLRKVIEYSGADPLRLKLELTESLVLDNVADTIAKMDVIKQLGVSFSMDDFGTGYSSLSYLTRLPLDQLKIDRAFVNRLPDNQSDAVIAQTIVTMGSSLGLKVLAEGVENEAQRQFLEDHGCHGYQGFLFSRPLPVDAFEQLLNQGGR
ncbi:EAL domain-containing protein [Candidatus Accumulibacter cognatus]|uniref:Cyclic di-GMP phosphodiesterase Gmr n=2 Tax=Candidatus Accumulibacter TaxID=327159 RepID=A0A080M7K4_9PROT|nr:EAL domain-containing protein [Candidatus Accumulibacter cognatus]KFB77262.1 MAG: Cyclic di-GMP phosphodiesterase Gmr [Candidatus Accumulibacter cognatus]